MRRETGRLSHSRYGMADAGTKPAFEVVPLQDGFERSEPPDRGTILDAHEQPVEIRKPLMARLDDKLTAPITISRGMAWMIGTALVVVPLTMGVLLYVISGAMSYQTVIGRVGTVETRVEKLEKAFDDVQGLKLTTNNMQNDIKSIRDQQTSDVTDRKKLMSDVADIRILLAQKGMQ